MFLSFNLKLELFDQQGKQVFSQDVTESSLFMIQTSITACPFTVASGGLTAYTSEMTVIDGASVRTVVEFTQQSFMDFLLGCENEANEYFERLADA